MENIITAPLNFGKTISCKKIDGSNYVSRDELVDIVIEARKETAPQMINRRVRSIGYILATKKMRKVQDLCEEVGIRQFVRGSKIRGTGWIHIFLAMRVLIEQVEEFDITKCKLLLEMLIEELDKIEIDKEEYMLIGAVYSHISNAMKTHSTIRQVVSKRNKCNPANLVKAMTILGSEKAVEVGEIF